MARKTVKIVVAEAAPPAPVAEPQVLPLPENLDLAAASEIARSLLAMRGSHLIIDASRVRHLGAQCGQVLVSASKTWGHDAADLRIVDGSAEFMAAVRLLGLSSALEIKEGCQ